MWVCLKLLIMENVFLLFLSNQHSRKMQLTFLGKIIPQSNISTDEQFPDTEDSSSPVEEARAGRGQRQELQCMANNHPGTSVPTVRTRLFPWVSCTAPDLWPPLAAAPAHQPLGSEMLCSNPPENLCSWPPPCTGGEGSHYLPLGTACGWVSQWCNTFISLPLISNLSLSTLCSPSPQYNSGQRSSCK